jgi:hypothetical protein
MSKHPAKFELENDGDAAPLSQARAGNNEILLLTYMGEENCCAV